MSDQGALFDPPPVEPPKPWQVWSAVDEQLEALDLLPDPTSDGPGKAFGGAPDTTRTAARLATPRTGTARHRVLAHIAEGGFVGATDEEMQHALNMNPSTQRPRRVELVEAGWIVDSGKRRKTASRMDAIVWVLSKRALREAS